MYGWSRPNSALFASSAACDALFPSIIFAISPGTKYMMVKIMTATARVMGIIHKSLLIMYFVIASTPWQSVQHCFVLYGS